MSRHEVVAPPDGAPESRSSVGIGVVRAAAGSRAHNKGASETLGLPQLSFEPGRDAWELAREAQKRNEKEQQRHEADRRHAASAAATPYMQILQPTERSPGGSFSERKAGRFGAPGNVSRGQGGRDTEG